MFQNIIISDKLSLYKFFKQLNFDLYLVKLQLKHLESIMNAMISKKSLIVKFPTQWSLSKQGIKHK